MEFLDEESKPKFQFQSRFSSTPISKPEPEKINKPLAVICVFISVIIFVLSIIFIESKALQFLVIWVSLAFSVGPFAPTSVTGGDIRVGHGELLEPSSDLDQTGQIDEPNNRRAPNRRQKVRRSEDPILNSNSAVGVSVNDKSSGKSVAKGVSVVCNGDGSGIFEEKEWVDEDFELLKKQLAKNPVGTPKRWELIAEAFRGRHGLDSVIKMAKSMPERRPNGDSFSQFLKQRKPLDKRIEEVNGELADNSSESNGGVNWSSAEDIALLNALKAFPKEAAMRWEKISAAVPGKSKACCMKRVTELKKDFRSSKASGDS